MRHVRTVGRTLLRIAKELSAEGYSGSRRPEISDCTPAIQEWFDEVSWVIADREKTVVAEFRLGDARFRGNQDGILAALRNLHVNAVRAVEMNEKANRKD